MSGLQAFFAQHAKKVQPKKHVVSKRFVDEKGNPIPWEFVPITAATDEKIRKECTNRIEVPGRKGVYMPEIDFDKYLLKVTVASIKYPDLNNAELQDSYGIQGAENLLQTMLLPGELAEAKRVAQEVNGFDVSFDDLVEEAKN